MKLVSFEQSYGGVIFHRDNDAISYLLLKYRNGHWGFPKGHVEKGEKSEETFLREVREETGLKDIKIIQGFYEKERYFYIAKGKELEERRKNGRGMMIFKRVDYFLGEAVQREVVLSKEHLDFSWLNFKEALKKATFKNSKDILKKADDFLSSRIS